MPLISIIVPVYNTGKDLPRCIDSILAQSFSDFELLLIDDGSKDDSLQVCQEYANKDSRIRVFHKENGGVSSARNFGIEKAQGEYMTFIDSDDYVGENYLADLYEKHDFDLVICGYTDSDGNNLSPQAENLRGDSFLKRSVVLLHDSSLFNSSCEKLYHSCFIKDNGLRFDSRIRFGEDTVFAWNYFIHCQSLSVINRGDYFYTTVWRGGDTSSKYNLTLEEYEYSLSKQLEALRSLDVKFGSRLHEEYYGNDRVIGGLFAQYTNTLVWEILKRHHEDWSLSYYLENIAPKQIKDDFSGLRDQLMRGKKALVKQRLREMNHFYTFPAQSIRFVKKTDKHVYSAIQKKRFWLAYSLLSTVYHLRGVKKFFSVHHKGS